MATIRVLKHFVFTFPPTKGERTPTEQIFRTGYVEVSDDHPILTHPWYLQDHCDGHVESPKQMLARLEQEKRDLEQQEALNKVSKAAAEAAISRLRNLETGVVVNKDALDKELNTPIPQLKAAQAAKATLSIDKKLS